MKPKTPILSDLISDYICDPDAGLRKLLAWVLNSVLLEESTQQCGCDPYERSSSRQTRRNGYKPRSLKTKFGDIVLDKPEFRDRPFHSQVFENYSRVDLSLQNAIVESYLQGMSTRHVSSVVEKFGVEHLSASAVSRISHGLDEEIAEFLSSHRTGNPLSLRGCNLCENS